jgi:hypothetical protein
MSDSSSHGADTRFSASSDLEKLSHQSTQSFDKASHTTTTGPTTCSQGSQPQSTRPVIAGPGDDDGSNDSKIIGGTIAGGALLLTTLAGVTYVVKK